MGVTVARWLYRLDLELAHKAANVSFSMQPENFQTAEHQDCSVCSPRCILHC